jgi:predicted acyl esterase
VQTGVVDYQDTGGGWHQADRWPPRSEEATVHLSGRSVVPEGAPVAPATQTFQSADVDPGLHPSAGTPHYAVTACGPHQALYVSRPVEQDVLLAGNFEADVKLSSTLPGGNFAVTLWKTSGPGTCPDAAASVVGRAHMDLRHWAVSGLSHEFPVATPTAFSLRSAPFAGRLRKGERLVVAVGGGAVELTPDPLHPVLTLDAGSLHLPVVDGALRFAEAGQR